MAGMAGHGFKWLYMSGKGSTCLELLYMAVNCMNGWKWLEIAENIGNWLEMAVNSIKWLELAGNGWKLEMP